LRVLFDTNVVLDVMLDRKPFAEDAVRLFSQVEGGSLSGWICATTVTTIHYLATKVIGADRANEAMRQLLSLFEVAAVNRGVLESALQLPFADFQDAVIHEAARHVALEGIITRDHAGFQRAFLPVYSPKELLSALDSQ
jgi:predicted nucleic acid-binding protein